MENKTLAVLVVEPQKKPYAKEIGGDLKSLQHEVGGYIQAVYPFREPVALICDEEGKLSGQGSEPGLAGRRGTDLRCGGRNFLDSRIGRREFYFSDSGTDGTL